MSQTQKLSANNTTVYIKGLSQCVMLYSTEIIKHIPSTKHVQFDTGGHFTATTQNRMNQAMNEWGIPLQVKQEKGLWYVHNESTRERLQFCGNICIMRY